MDGDRGGVRLVPGLAVRAGQTIAGKYRVEELLGSGASGIVISARNIHLRQPVVLKILASYTDGQEELLQRRLTKARLAARLQSSHVARIVDIGVTDDAMPYVATECLEGTTLEVELEERGQLPVDEAVRWVLEACEGLAEAHAAGLIHGDLKPQNIFLAKPKAGARSRAINDGADDASIDPRVLKILDFGTTSPLDGIGDQSAAFFGSPAFLAPEQIKDPSNVDARADVWALGVLLYNLVSGGLPFAADTVSGVIVAVVYDAPAMLVDAPYELAKIVARCLEKDPAKRPGNVKELAAELAPFAGALGARLSERVATMLAGASARHSKPADSSPADTSASITPVSVTVEPPSESDEALPLVTLATRPAAAPVVSEVAHRSKRVVARRSRTKTLGLLGAIALLAIVGGAATRTPRLRLGSASSTTTLTSEHIDLPAPVATINAPVATINAPVELITATDELPGLPTNAEPVISFAPSALQPSTPTPLAVTPTPLASEPIAPEVLPDVLSTPPPPLATAPAPRPATAITVAPVVRGATTAARAQVAPVGGGTPITRLPAGLPTSREPVRDPLPPFGASPPRQTPSAPRNNQPSLSSTRTDGSNSRNLFSERK